MKGTVVSTWMKTCKKNFSDDIVSKAMEKEGLSKNKTFSPFEDVNDNTIKNIIKNIANSVNMQEKKLWNIIGKDNVVTFTKDYPAFFKHENFYHFLKSMNDVHEIVVKRIPGSKPPIFEMENISDDEVLFTYKSKRGMFDYFEGLLEGGAAYFKENIKINEIEKKSDMMKIKIKFPYICYEKKKYRFNKLMSLGFIRDINFKVAIFATIIFAIIEFPISLINSNLSHLLSILSALFSVSLSSKLLNKPMDIIFEEFKTITNRDYSKNNHIETNDIYEDLFLELNKYKEHLKRDFVGFKGLTDEMATFSRTLNQIASNMSVTSDEISDIVEQLATAAVSQAEETEKSVSILDDNVEAIKLVAKEEQVNKDDLEGSIIKIETGFNNVENTANKLIDILSSFNNVKENGYSLRDKVSDITNVVELVSSISYQTNLLALNASIEAARAGEMGKGFAVVAEEVRKLAEETQNAVEKISGNLNALVTGVSSLVEDIDTQYSILEKENEKLSFAVNNSSKANDNIKSVANRMYETAKKLQSETKSINSVFSNIESLAAIAEENSASAEEVSANVTTYTDELQNLTNSIKEFNDLTKDFSKEINVYKI
ncbi:heme NO-binding domain-containing protein [Peptostreptococcaceae bacterium AGR-M142]